MVILRRVRIASRCRAISCSTAAVRVVASEIHKYTSKRHKVPKIINALRSIRFARHRFAIINQLKIRLECWCDSRCKKSSSSSSFHHESLGRSFAFFSLCQANWKCEIGLCFVVLGLVQNENVVGPVVPSQAPQEARVGQVAQPSTDFGQQIKTRRSFNYR